MKTMEQINELSFLQEIKVDYKKNFGNETVGNSKKASDIFRQAYSKTNCNIALKEFFFIVLLNRSNSVIGFHKLSEGSISQTTADVRLAFSTAIKCIASAMLICHNHPSNSLKFSEADIKLTNKFKAAGEILDIPLLDSLILTEDSYASMADEGIL